MVIDIKMCLFIGLIFTVIWGCEERPTNILIGDKAFKIVAPQDFCLDKVGYPISEEQLGQYRSMAEYGINIYAVYKRCDNVVNKVALLGIPERMADKSYLDSQEAFAKSMKEEFLKSSPDEIKVYDDLATGTVRENIPSINDIKGGNFSRVESDKLAAYFERQMTVSLIGLGKQDWTVNGAISMIKGKPFMFILAQESDETDRLIRGALRAWVKRMDDIN